MKIIASMIMFLILISSCSTKSFSLNDSYTFQLDQGTNFVLTVEQLDKRAINYLSNEWAKPVSEFSSWNLYDVTYSEEKQEVILRYDRGFAPRIFVYFDSRGNTMKWQGYK